jgi:hypothetical protein
VPVSVDVPLGDASIGIILAIKKNIERLIIVTKK